MLSILLLGNSAAHGRRASPTVVLIAPDGTVLTLSGLSQAVACIRTDREASVRHSGSNVCNANRGER